MAAKYLWVTKNTIGFILLSSIEYLYSVQVICNNLPVRILEEFQYLRKQVKRKHSSLCKINMISTGYDIKLLNSADNK